MPTSNIVKNMRDGKIVLSDFGGANSLEITVEPGDFKLDVPQEQVQNYLDRGRMGSPPHLRFGEEQPMTGSFSVHMRGLSSASTAMVEQLIHGTGYLLDNWVSTMGAAAEVFTLDITYSIEGTDHGDSADHSIVLPFCVVRGSFEEGDPNKASFSFTSYAVRPSSVT